MTSFSNCALCFGIDPNYFLLVSGLSPDRLRRRPEGWKRVAGSSATGQGEV